MVRLQGSRKKLVTREKLLKVVGVGVLEEALGWGRGVVAAPAGPARSTPRCPCLLAWPCRLTDHVGAVLVEELEVMEGAGERWRSLGTRGRGGSPAGSYGVGGVGQGMWANSQAVS